MANSERKEMCKDCKFYDPSDKKSNEGDCLITPPKHAECKEEDDN